MLILLKIVFLSLCLVTFLPLFESIFLFAIYYFIYISEYRSPYKHHTKYYDQKFYFLFFSALLLYVYVLCLPPTYYHDLFFLFAFVTMSSPSFFFCFLCLLCLYNSRINSLYNLLCLLLYVSFFFLIYFFWFA